MSHCIHPVYGVINNYFYAIKGNYLFLSIGNFFSSFQFSTERESIVLLHLSYEGD